MTVGTILTATAMAKTGEVAGSAVNNAFNKLPNGSLRGTVAAIHQQWSKGAGRTIVSASQDLRVEPLVLVDERVSRLPYVTDVLEAVQRLFSSYYMLSVAADNTIGSLTVQKRIGKFSPDRDLVAATSNFLSVEAYQFGLPRPDDKNGFDRYSLFSPESTHPHYEEESMEAGASRDIYKQATEINNLSIGQIVNVNIVEGNNSATIPVMIRLRVIGTSPEGAVAILGLGMDDNSTSARWMKVKVGALSLKDAITNQDQIDAYRRASFADKSGYFRKAHAQANKGLLATLLTGEPSVGSISSVAVISYQTQRELENTYYGNLDDYVRRQQVFVKSLLMMIVVVDDDADTITIYTRDIEDKQTYTLSDLKKSSKTNNNDLTELLKSFLNGQIPGRL